MKLNRVARESLVKLLSSRRLILGPLFCLSLGLVSFAFSAEVSAATKTWVGGTPSNTNWSNASNWSPAGVPVDGDAITFDCNSTDQCTSIFDIPGLEVSSITFSGTSVARVDNPTSAPIVLKGDISSVTPGSVFSGDIVLGADIKATNTMLGAVDLNDYRLSLRGRGVVKPTSGEQWIGIGGDITGNGELSIDVENDQEVYLSGENTYSGVTDINSGRFVSNGQSDVNATMAMFGVSDVRVGPLGKVVFTFNEAETGFSFDNLLTFNRLDPALAQLLVVNKSSNNSTIAIAFSNIELKSATRFDVDITSGGLTVDLDGIAANNYCIEYGSDGAQASYFQNGPICEGDKDPNANGQVPLKPKTGVIASSVAVVVIGAGISLASYQIRKKVKLNSTGSDR